MNKPIVPLGIPAGTLFKEGYEEMPEALAQWTQIALISPDWKVRARLLLNEMDRFKPVADIDQSDEFIGRGFSAIITAALESLRETEISTLEAAAFYAISAHAEWHQPAVGWIMEFGIDKFQAWSKQRANYQTLAIGATSMQNLVPSWIASRQQQ